MEDGSFFDEKDLIFPNSLPKDLIYGPALPLSAIARLVGEEAETFRVIAWHVFLFAFTQASHEACRVERTILVFDTY